MTERLRVREIDDDEGRRLVRIIRRGSGSVVTWRRAQMVLLSAQGMGVPAIAKVAFTSEDRVRDVIRNFNADGFGSLYPKYKGGRPPKFTLAERREIKKIAKSKPAEHDLPFSEGGGGAAVPARHPHRDHLRQLQPAPDHSQRRPGRDLAAANNAEIACTPANSSSLNRIEVSSWHGGTSGRRYRRRQPPRAGRDVACTSSGATPRLRRTACRMIDRQT